MITKREEKEKSKNWRRGEGTRRLLSKKILFLCDDIEKGAKNINFSFSSDDNEKGAKREGKGEK